MTDKGWFTRLHEAATFPVKASWDEVWPLLARAQVEPQRMGDVKQWLWSRRQMAWVCSLDGDGVTCRYCGERKPTPSRADRLFCSDACRVAAHQTAGRGQPWPLQRAVAAAERSLQILEEQQREAAAWLSETSPVGIVPPDLAAYDNLPPMPDRCGGGCGGPCRWTRGGPCLYAGTAQET